MNPFHCCKHVLRKTCLAFIFVCSICGVLVDDNERFPMGDETTVMVVAGTSVTSSATGLGGSVTFDPAKLIRNDWPDRS